MYRKLMVLALFICSIIYIAIIPNTTVIEENNNINVEVKGEVKKQEIVSIKAGSNIKDLLQIIELNKNADISQLSLLTVLHNNQIVTIPRKTSESKISINNANLYELSCLPGVGKSIAIKIIEYRNEYGSFISLEDIKNVSGIGDKKYEKIKPYICL